VLPADDARGETLAQRTRARVIRFGRSEGAHVRLRDERFDLSGSRATLVLPSGPIPVSTPLLGRFNLENVAAAAACAVAAGLPVGAISEGISSLHGIPGRLERVEAGQPFAVLVDYAHTEAALASALRAVREATPGRLGVVFGCGGDRDRGKRRAMGRVAAEVVDAAWMTSDNPRGEDPIAILEEVRAGFCEVPGASARGRVEPDRFGAIAAATAWARPGDAIVIAGKGHETTQTFADRTEIFDDRIQAARALAAAGWVAA
jgi:UDP-N-acetylmuramoyl-L-alanyl-D-glutamate--2,6-diaminopimelate ligase